MDTIASKVIKSMTAKGHKLLGKTSGTFSFHPGSNLARKLTELGLSEDDVIVKAGARAGRNATAGYELLIFSKETAQ